MKATAKDLRFHSKELLDTVNRGEEVLITYRGKPCARLIPYEQTEFKQSRIKNEFFGIWRDYDKITDVNEYVKKLREGRY